MCNNSPRVNLAGDSEFSCFRRTEDGNLFHSVSIDCSFSMSYDGPHFSTPAQPQNSPFLDTGILPLRLRQPSIHLGQNQRRRSALLEKSLESGPLLLIIRWEPCMESIFILQHVRNKCHCTGLCCEQVCSLKGLGVEAEDVVDDDDAGFGE